MSGRDTAEPARKRARNVTDVDHGAVEAQAVYIYIRGCMKVEATAYMLRNSHVTNLSGLAYETMNIHIHTTISFCDLRVPCGIPTSHV